MKTLPITFLMHACKVLGDTDEGFSGSNIVNILSAFAIEYNVEIPHCKYPFEAPNKRTALLENIKSFNAEQQYHILSELCKDLKQSQRLAVQELNKMLRQRYGMLDLESVAFDKALVSDTQHWLSKYPNALKSYIDAIEKRQKGIYQRNLLDDLRLALELLLKDILNNGKSLENQKSELGAFIEDIRGSKEFTNMFVKLIEYFSKYQNEHVKHDDQVVEIEIDFMVDITSAFMKSICRCV